MALSNEQERNRVLARAAASRHGLNPDLFVRQLWVENKLRSSGGSPAGAQGVAQFMPATAAHWGVDLNDGKVEDDLEGAARYMAYYVKKYGNYRDALIAYNAGEGRVGKRLPAETRAYIDAILHGANPGAGDANPGASASASSSGKPDTGGLVEGLLRVGTIVGGLAVAGLGLSRMVGVRTPGPASTRAAS